MNEVVNGLMLRADAARGRFTVCFVPAGSSNAMAWMTGVRGAAAAARALLAGATQPLDLFAFHQSGAVRYGFLSCHMATLADVDIDSEVCRWFGHARFPVYTAVKLLCCCCCAPCLPDHARTSYHLRVRWLPAASGVPPAVERPPEGPQHTPADSPGEWEEFEGDVQFFQLMSAPYMDPTMHCAPDARLDDGAVSLQLMRPTNRVALALCFGEIEQGKHLTGKRWTSAKARSVVVDRVAPGEKVVVDGELASRGRGFHLEPLPGFINVVVGDPPPPRAASGD